MLTSKMYTATYCSQMIFCILIQTLSVFSLSLNDSHLFLISESTRSCLFLWGGGGGSSSLACLTRICSLVVTIVTVSITVVCVSDV